MSLKNISIREDYLNLIDKISASIKIPRITDIYIPSIEKGGIITQKNAFGAIVLGEKFVGIIYINLTHNAFIGVEIDLKAYIGKDPIEVAKKFSSSNEIEKTIALGAINAISQFILQKSNYSYQTSKDSLGGLNPTPTDKIGMVGFFPPLVKQLEEMKIPLTIIEKKDLFITNNKSWKVTLDPSALNDRNKVLCTSTIVLNETVDEILSNCQSAEKIAIVGPTGGYLPDPLFERGINVVGGTKINDAELFLKLLRSNQRWGPATVKYIMKKENYPGLDRLLESI